MMRMAARLERRNDLRPAPSSVLAALAALWLLALPRLAAADDPQYKELVTSALAEFDAGHWEESAALFEQAHRMSPSARTSRGLGIAYFEARKYALAVPHLRAALSDTRRPLTTEQRAGVQNTLRRAEGFVARYALELEPAETSLELDSRPAALAGGELLVDPGQHQLIASAPGYQTERRVLEAVAGTRGELALHLTRVDEAPAAATETSPPAVLDGVYVPPAAHSSSPFPVLPMIATGVGVAALGAGAVTGVLTRDQESKLERECRPGVDCRSGVDKGNRLELATNLLLIGGGVISAAGLAWWLIEAGAFAGPSEPAPAQLSALCLPQLCGASVAASF